VIDPGARGSANSYLAKDFARECGRFAEDSLGWPAGGGETTTTHMATQELQRTSSASTEPFDPYAPPRAELVRPASLERTPDWVYPLVLDPNPGWLFKLHVELRDAIGRTILTGTFRWQLWELFGFRLKRDPALDLPWIEVRPRKLYSGMDLVFLDGGEETASLKCGLVLAPWEIEGPGGIYVSIRPTNAWIRRRERGRGAAAWPPLARVGQQLSALGPQGYPIVTVHAGRTLPPFMVVRRSFEGPIQTTRVERLEGEVKPEAEWLALQALVGAFLCRVPGVG
jgi:hypothetical protein